MKNNILNLFGLGKAKFSATTASLVAVAMYFAVCKLPADNIAISFSLFFVVLIWSLVWAQKNKSYAESDSKEIVVDEFLGMYACLLIANTIELVWLALLFVAFRALDILKPPPFSIIDKKLKSGFGVLADDIAIGVFLGIVFRIIARFIL